jgi:hypothetical protein
MRIDLLYFNGCPSWEEALSNIRAALDAENLEAKVSLVNIESDQEAAQLKFLGSPSFQVDGVDWWNEERSQYNLSCRIYVTPDGVKGAPTVDMLREKLRAMRV